jgi:hypothetical protein
MFEEADEKVHGWLYDNLEGLKEKIVFRDRIEYRVSGELHNHIGPAIIYTYDGLHKTHPDSENSEEYYLKGIKMDKEQWVINTRKYRIKKIIKKTKKEENNE